MKTKTLLTLNIIATVISFLIFIPSCLLIKTHNIPNAQILFSGLFSFGFLGNTFRIIKRKYL